MKFLPGLYTTRNGCAAEVFVEKDGRYWGRLRWSEDERSWHSFEWEAMPHIEGLAWFREMSPDCDLMPTESNQPDTDAAPQAASTPPQSPSERG